MVTTTTAPLDRAVLDQLEEDVGSELIQEILEVFSTDAARLGRELAEAMARGDLKTVSTTAHTLKGTSATVGAKALAELAKQLEKIAASGDEVTAAALVESITEDLAAVLTAVDAACVAR